jgi:glycosyltransferase involved in cell wall biosynthesis
MRVLYVDQTGQLGGGEIAILPWIQVNSKDALVVLFSDGPFREALESSGVAVTVLELEGLKGIRRESGLKSLVRVVPAFLKLRKTLAEIASGFDLVYANSQKAFLLSAFAKRRGQPLVWHLRDILSTDHFSSLLIKAVVRVANSRASVVIVNSQATADSFIAAGGHREKVQLVYDGVSAAPFDSVPESAIAIERAELGASPLIGIFGRLCPWKGQHIFLEAIARVPNARGVLIGDALFGEAEYVATLKKRAVQPDLAGRISFLGFRRDIPTLMKSMDVIVHASVSAEPFGLVIVEGMLASKPVIATRAGGAMEIMQEAECGLLTTPGSVEELAEAIRNVLNDPVQAARMAKAGRRRAETTFTLEACLAGIRHTLERVSTLIRIK